MPQFPESGIRLVADASDFTDTMSEALSLAAEFDALGDIDVSLTANADTSEIDSMQAAIDEIEAAGGTVDFNVEEDEDTKSLFQNVKDLRDIKVIETIWNIAGTAVDLLGKGFDAFVSPMLDLDDAVAKVNAQTGSTIPNARELISGIFYDDLGDSIDQVGKLVIQAQQIGAPIDEATRAALEFTHTFKDEDPTAVLNTMDQMVKNGLAPDFKTAGDNLTVAFQNGANRGGDLLTTINDNAGAIRDLGLTGPQAMEVFTSGMDAGFKSSQDVLNTLIKIKQNVTAAAGNPTSDVSKTLDMIGVANPADTGEAWSLDFFQSVIDGIKNAPVSDTDKQTMFSNLLGSKVGAKEFSNLMRLSPEDWANVFSNVDGASATAASVVDDSLRGALDDFGLAADKAMQDFLSSDQIDLPGKIAALKVGLQDALDTLASGGSLGDALTVGLKPIGFGDEFQKLEAIFGDFILSLMNLIADIQDVMGKDSSGTRAAISEQAKSQTAFDLVANDPSKIMDTLTTGFAKGLKLEDFAATLQQAVDTLVAQGDLGGAQALLDASKTLQLQATSPDTDINAVNASIVAATQAAQDLINAGLTQASRSTEAVGTHAATGGAQAMLSDLAQTQTTSALNDMATAATDLTPTVRDAEQADIDRKDALDELKTVTTTSTASLDVMTTTTDELNTAAGNAAASQSDMAASLGNILAQEQALEAQYAAGAISLEQFNVQFANLMAIASAGGGATPTELGNASVDTPSGVKAAGGIIPGGATHLVGENGPELVTAGTTLSVLNNKSTQALMSALQGFVPGASGAGNSVRNTTLNQYNIVNSQADASALGYETARQIRSQ